MREIKFRAWDTLRKCYDHDPLVFHGKACYIDSFDALEFYDIGRFILEQYTGFKDKNGKEIYEGEILTNGKVVYRVDYKESHAQYCLKVIKTTYVLTKGLHFPLWQYIVGDSCILEAIGNIHQHPELLEG